MIYQNRLLVIGGRFNCEVKDTIHQIQLTFPNTSTLLRNMSRAICYHGVVTINEKIFIIAGTTTEFFEGTTDTVLVFDPTTNTCTKLEPLPYRVLYMATVAWKDNVVVLGGDDDEDNTYNTVILNNVTTRSHRKLPEMTKKRYDCRRYDHRLGCMG